MHAKIELRSQNVSPSFKLRHRLCQRGIIYNLDNIL